MRIKVEVFLVFFLLVLFSAESSFSDNLPEFFGSYIQLNNNTITELSQNKNIGTTGWFIKQQTSKSNNLNDLQKQLSTGGDLGAALRATSNLNQFVTSFSGINISPAELKGYILYGEFSIEDVKLYKLSNKMIPEDATFVEYKGPKPIERNNMWLPSVEITIRSKPIQDKMYFVKPSDELSCGCYMFVINNKFYDFKITSSDKDPFLGKYLYTTYMKEKKIFGKTYINGKGEVYINEIDTDGNVKGIDISIDPKTNEILSQDTIFDAKIDKKNKKYSRRMEDKGEEGSLYGSMEGDFYVNTSNECDCLKIETSLTFFPYEKYKAHEFLTQYEIYVQMVKQ